MKARTIVLFWFFLATGAALGVQRIGGFKSQADCRAAREWAQNAGFNVSACFEAAL
jgi:hypothetical protein